jgi:hypothetical protein
MIAGQCAVTRQIHHHGAMLACVVAPQPGHLHAQRLSGDRQHHFLAGAPAVQIGHRFRSPYLRQCAARSGRTDPRQHAADVVGQRTRDQRDRRQIGPQQHCTVPDGFHAVHARHGSQPRFDVGWPCPLAVAADVQLRRQHVAEPSIDRHAERRNHDGHGDDERGGGQHARSTARCKAGLGQQAGARQCQRHGAEVGQHLRQTARQRWHGQYGGSQYAGDRSVTAERQAMQWRLQRGERCDDQGQPVWRVCDAGCAARAEPP